MTNKQRRLSFLLNIKARFAVLELIVDSDLLSQLQKLNFYTVLRFQNMSPLREAVGRLGEGRIRHRINNIAMVNIQRFHSVQSHSLLSFSRSS